MATSKGKSPTKLTNLVIGEGSVVDAGANQRASIMLYKRKGDSMRTLPLILAALAMPDQTVITDEIAKARKEGKDEASTEVSKLQGEISVRDATIAKLQPKPTEEDILKSVPESIRKQLVDERAARVDLEKRLTAETDIRETREFIEKARTTYTNLPIAADKLGAVLKQASKVSKEFAADLETVLTSANEIAKAGAALTKELGRHDTSHGSDSAFAKMRKLAEESVVAKRAKTPEQGFDLVCQENPSLYKQYLAEQRG